MTWSMASRYSRLARTSDLLAAALGADRLPLPRFGFRTGWPPPARWGLLGHPLRVFRRRRRRSSAEGKLLVTRLGAHIARGLQEKEACASLTVGSGMDDQSNLVWRGEIADTEFADRARRERSYSGCGSD